MSVFVYLNTFIVLFVWLCVFAYLYLPVRNIEMFCDNRINPRNCLPAVSLYKKRSPLKKVLANKNLLLTYLPYLRYIFPLSQNLNVSILEQSLALKWRQLHLYIWRSPYQIQGNWPGSSLTMHFYEEINI